MRKVLSFLALCGLPFILNSCAQKTKIVPRDIASLEASGIEGIWFLQGTNSVRGPYNGELELRKSNDGTFDVIRVATYINSYFEGLKVQEVWQGKAVPTEDVLTISYDLKQAEFIQRLDKEKRSLEDFQNTFNIVARFSPQVSGLEAKFKDKRDSAYSEWITTRRDLEEKPLWVNQRENREALGSVPPEALTKIRKFKSDLSYDKDSFVKAYEKYPEYKHGRAYFIFDPTDFDFYRKNKDVIRVNNKLTDNISIAESVVRRNAYAPSLVEKQRGYESNTKDFHLNEYGMVSYAQLDKDGKFLGFVPDVDAALWTGAYVGSQAMRYQVTQDKEALFNIRKSLKGLKALLDVAEEPGEFARTVARRNPLVDIPSDWKQGKAPYTDLIWLDGGNHDMIQGVFHALAWAHVVIPEKEHELHRDLQELVQKLPDLRVVKGHPENQRQALGLKALYSKDTTALASYRQLFKPSGPKSTFEEDFSFHGNADWHQAYLTSLRAVTEILIAEGLEEDSILNSLREDLLKKWAVYQDADRHIISLAAKGFALRGVQVASFTPSQKENLQKSLDKALWGLREIPYPRPDFNVTLDLSLKPEWVLSPTPREFWKPLKRPQPPMSYFYQGLYNYPVFELQAFSSNYVWKDSAFMFQTSNNRNLESSGVDFLYGYWLGRYGEVINGSEAE